MINNGTITTVNLLSRLQIE